MPDSVIGMVLDSRYKVISRLGSGGMADVYLAEDQQLGRKLALKLLHRRFAEDPDFVERFRREAQAAAGLQHPNVVSVYDRGAYDDTYYIAMEYLPGRTLKQLIRSEAPLDPVRAIDIATQILKAARFAHRRGVIHRDLKPHNVIIDESDHAKVTDFGIARAGASDMTETGSIMGTAQYLSPEQAQGHVVSAASDLYSVAVVLYEMLTGRVPFDAEAAVTIAIKHVSEAPTPPTAANPGVPAELEQVVLWALNKNPADRPTDADQFISALEWAKGAIVSGQAGERTASFAAVGGRTTVQGGSPGAAISSAPTASPAGEETAPPALPVPLSHVDGEATGVGMGDGHHEPGRVWWWTLALALILVLLLAVGGVAAYLLTRPKQVVVPAVTGETLNLARTRVLDAGLALSVVNVTGGQPAGTVIGESPGGGMKVDKDSTVTLTVSQGPGNTVVPAVQSEPLAAAKQAILQQNLKVGSVVKQPSSQYAGGIVIQTQPVAGQSVPIGTPVELFVSSGSPSVAVPDETGQSEAAARSALTNAGFRVVTTNQTSTTVQPGNVISQSPGGGAKEPTGTTVTLVIAQAPATVAVPRVTGEMAAAAADALGAAGFNVSETTKAVKHQARDGIVLSESPPAGSQQKKGTVVTLVVGKFTQTTTTPTTTTPTTTTPTTTTPTTPTTTT